MCYHCLYSSMEMENKRTCFSRGEGIGRCGLNQTSISEKRQSTFLWTENAPQGQKYIRTGSWRSRQKEKTSNEIC